MLEASHHGVFIEGRIGFTLRVGVACVDGGARCHQEVRDPECGEPGARKPMVPQDPGRVGGPGCGIAMLKSFFLIPEGFGKQSK